MGEGEEEVLGGLGEGREGPGEGSGGSFSFPVRNPRPFVNFLCECRQTTLDKKFGEHVALVPMAVCDQLENLEKRRREELAELEGQVDTLLRDSRNLHSG